MTPSQANKILDELAWIFSDLGYFNYFADEDLDEIYWIDEQILAVSMGLAN